MEVGVSTESTWIELIPAMWKITANKRTKPFKFITFLQKEGYPKPLKAKYVEQLEKVYNTCVHPGQFLPLLFTAENNQQLLSAGLHISEQLESECNYIVQSRNDIPQHCKYKTGMHMPVSGILHIS